MTDPKRPPIPRVDSPTTPSMHAVQPPPLPPPQPPTVRVPAMTDRALLEDLTKTIKEGFARQSTQLLDFGERLVTVEQGQQETERRMYEFEGRLIRSSSRVKHVSDSDLSQEARLAQAHEQLAQERAAREALAERVQRIEHKTDDQTKMLTDIRNAVVGVIRNKKVVFVGKVIFGIAVAYSGLKGIQVLP